MTAPRILAIGGAHVDRRGQMTSPFVPGASIPGTMREDVGGGAFNALRSAVQRGAEGAMISLRGGDAAGGAVGLAIAEAGILDLSAVFLDRATLSYTGAARPGGRRGGSAGRHAALRGRLPETASAGETARGDRGRRRVLCDANIPAAGLQRLASLTEGKPLFAIAISPAKAVRLAEILPALACLYMNRREAAALASMDVGDPVEAIVDRLRTRGLRAASSPGRRPGDRLRRLPWSRPCRRPCREVADVTGAGDALAGAMTVALLGGTPFGEALHEGMAAALLAVENPASVPALSKQAFAEALALVSEAAERQLRAGAQP